MTIHLFYNDDNGYELWCKENEKGFVFNHYGGNENSGNMNLLHHVKCHSLWRECDQGKRTTTYEKICSTELDKLIGFVQRIRQEAWSYCKIKKCTLLSEKRNVY